MIELTVALPMYRSGKIGWLALESLCRQRGVTFDWELIICEEQTPDFLGKNIIDQYSAKLSSVGCKRILYKPLYEWVPLSMKWKIMGEKADNDSKMFVCQADDNFAHPDRLREVYERMGYDYVCYPHCFFYFIRNNEVYHHTIRRYSPRTPAKGLQYSFKTKYAKAIPGVKRPKIVDQWLYDAVRKRAGKSFTHAWITTDTWKMGFNTHGFHRLSDDRYKKFKGKTTPYNHNWPEDIMLTLRGLRKEAKL